MAVLILFLSCKSLMVEQDVIYGTFYKLDKGKDFSSSYTLELNQDGSFVFEIKLHMANPQCKGKWRMVDNEIFLECEEITDPTKMISGAYMNKREHTLLIVNKNKLKYDDVVLKRKK